MYLKMGRSQQTLHCIKHLKVTHSNKFPLYYFYTTHFYSTFANNYWAKIILNIVSFWCGKLLIFMIYINDTIFKFQWKKFFSLKFLQYQKKTFHFSFAKYHPILITSFLYPLRLILSLPLSLPPSRRLALLFPFFLKSL